MSSSLKLSIPVPCHENWENMTPTEQGRFCASCKKEVVDFSIMTDVQILRYFSNYSGNTCGNFELAQLERPLTNGSVNNRNWLRYVMSFLLPAFIISDKTHAQERLRGDTIAFDYKRPVVSLTNSKTVETRTEKVSAAINTSVNIFIVDELNRPVSNASIICKQSRVGFMADSLGSCKINRSRYRSGDTLVISAVGYETTEFPLNRLSSDTTITLKTSLKQMQEVVLSSYQSRILRCRVGGLSIVSVKKITFIDTLKNLLLKHDLTIYPNPVAAGNNVTLDISTDKTGEYQMQMVNVSGQLMLSKEFNVIFKRYTETINIPPSIPAGTYFIRLTNMRTKKSNTGKLIVQ